MRLLRSSVRVHKWVALIVGVQMMFWVAGGVFMTTFPIDQVRGRNHAAELAPAALDFGTLLPVGTAATRARITGATKAELIGAARGPVWRFSVRDRSVVVDATTGAVLQPLSREVAIAHAAKLYSGEGRPKAAELLAKAPAETGKIGALWRVTFDDNIGSTLYLDPLTGEVVSRRSTLWRMYDFMFRLHIMNFGDGENFHHPLIRIASGVAFTLVLSGVVLLGLRLARDLRKPRPSSRTQAAEPAP